MEIKEAGIPYVRFEVRPVEDRAASIEAGHFVAKDVTYAIITPPGSKDELEKEAEAWLRDTKYAVDEDRVPATWLQHYKSLYTEFKEGNELPESGTPIRTWPVLSPAQIANVVAANIRTVEDLANANESALQFIGMGAAALRQKAKDWLTSAEKNGKPTEALSALKKQVESLEARATAAEARAVELEKKLEEAEDA